MEALLQIPLSPFPVQRPSPAGVALGWVIENENQTWAKQMQDLLLEIKATVDEHKDNSKAYLELKQLLDFESRYSNIIKLGYEENPVLEFWEKH